MTQHVDEAPVVKEARAVLIRVPSIPRNVDAPPRLRKNVENTKVGQITVADENFTFRGDRDQ